jgi:hypothetical protein
MLEAQLQGEKSQALVITGTAGKRSGTAADNNGFQPVRPRRSNAFEGILNDKELADRAWPSSSNGSDSSNQLPSTQPGGMDIDTLTTSGSQYRGTPEARMLG